VRPPRGAAEGAPADEDRDAVVVRGLHALRRAEQVRRHRAGQRQQVDVADCEAAAQVLRRQRRDDDADPHVVGPPDGGRHARRKGVPLPLGAGQQDVPALSGPSPADGHGQGRQRRLGDGRGGVLVGHAPPALLPEGTDPLLGRREAPGR
jgi:hypothetical protein